MERKTIGDMLRYLAQMALNGNDQPAIPFDAIALNLIGKPRDQVSMDEITEQVEMLKKRLNASYACTTINRMKEVIEADKSCSVKFGTDDDRGGMRTITIGLKDGAPRNKVTTKTAEAIANIKARKLDGYREGLEVMLSFVPDFMEYDAKKLAIAQDIVRQYREHAAACLEASK